MALKIFAIAIMLFLAEIVFLTTKDFKESSFTRNDLDYTDIAFEKMHGYVITAEGVEANIKAEKLLKYSDKIVLEEVESSFASKHRQNQIDAKEADIEDDIITLKGDVVYENNESTTFKTDTLVYNTKTKVATSDTPFTMQSLQGNVTGEGFTYNEMNKTMHADEIHYIGSMLEKN